MGLDIVELIMLVESEFEFQIPDNEAENLTTVQQLCNYTFEHIKFTKNVCSKQEVEHIICGLIEEVTGILQSKIKMSDAFINDLGMN